MAMEQKSSLAKWRVCKI